MTEHAIQTEKAEYWRILRLFNLYRISLSLMFFSLSSSDNLPSSLGALSPDSFYTYSLGYFAAAFFAAFPIIFQKPSFKTQLYLQTGIDIFFITMLAHMSGGLSSGLGILLIVTIANNSSLVVGITPYVFATIASFAVLAEQTFNFINHGDSGYQYAGFTGLALFITAIITQVMARRVRETQELAEQRSVDLANMAQLTDYVIKQMDTGIIAIDPGQRIHLMNQSAQTLLGISSRDLRKNLGNVSAELSNALNRWLEDKTATITPIKYDDRRVEVLPRFTTIGIKRVEGVLIFLDDYKKRLEQAQQIKLAALGRLVASIAHEIRNPLASISHANELLSESPVLQSGDRRLTDIIHNNTHRLNNIVETILQLGKRSQTQPEEIIINNWLIAFVSEFRSLNNLDENDIVIRVTDKSMVIRFDTTHLHQIIWNLCSNGIRYANESRQPKVELVADRSKGIVKIAVIDSGQGIPQEHQSEIFEPFFTTDSSGNGLGLYISRELAAANGADLNYSPTPNGQSCFILSSHE